MLISDPENIKRDISFQIDYPLIVPKSAMFNVIKRCNAGCQYCVDWRNDPNPNTDPPRAEITRILLELTNLGVKTVIFSGGEPLLRRDIFELMEYARQIGLNVSLITNGTALTQEGAYRLASLNVTKIGVSIDSLDPVRAKSLRGLQLKQVLRAIDILAHLKAKEYPNLHISLYVTITRLNIADILPLSDYAKEKEVNVQYQPVHFSGSGTPEHVLTTLWPSSIEINQLAEIVKELIVRKHKGYPILSRDEFLMQIPNFFHNRTFYPGEQCTAAYTDVVIDTNFGIRPCWPMEPVAYLSSTLSVQQVWFSDVMRDARRIIRQKKCPGCLYSCHINKSYVNLPSL